MAIELKERLRRRGNNSATRLYTVRTDASETDTQVAEYLVANAPTISGLQLADVDAEELAVVSSTQSVYLGTLEYGLAGGSYVAQAANEVRVSSRGSVQPVKLKYSKGTVSSDAQAWFNGGAAVDFGGQIGVDSDGEVQGADVLIPHNVLTVSNILPATTVTPSYQYSCEQLVGKVNSVEYRSRAAGTLFCLNVSFSQLDEDTFGVAAEFQFEPNQTGLTIGGLTGIAKKGWEYIWTYNVPRKVGNRIVPTIAQVNVETIHDTANFATVLTF